MSRSFFHVPAHVSVPMIGTFAPPVNSFFHFKALNFPAVLAGPAAEQGKGLRRKAKQGQQIGQGHQGVAQIHQLPNNLRAPDRPQNGAAQKDAPVERNKGSFLSLPFFSKRKEGREEGLILSARIFQTVQKKPGLTNAQIAMEIGCNTEEVESTRKMFGI